MRLFIPMVLYFLFIGCQTDKNEVITPKPRMYPFVELPAHQYEKVTEKSDCGFIFRKSVYATIYDRSTFFDEELQNTCWFDLKYKDLNANVHFTYYPIGREHKYDELTNESFRMVYEHSTVASAIKEIPILKDGHETGMSFYLRGPVASPYQFFMSDTTTHFLRASLYFETRPNPDSIAPVLDYILTDMDTLIKSLQWH